MDSSAQELTRILSTDTSNPATPRERLQPTDEIVLYGAGNLGALTLRNLRQVGVNPIAFADDTPEKQGQIINGIPVMSAAGAVDRFGDKLVFVVTIMNPKLRFLDARKRLKSLTTQPVYSFLHVAHLYPEAFLPYYQFELPKLVQGKAKDILAGFDLWTDEESRRQFIAHIKFRLCLDHKVLPRNPDQGYLPRELFPRLPADTVFVDCGAYDGDTIRQFLSQQNYSFGKIYAFEPDEKNCDRLRDYANSLGKEMASRIKVFNAAVGNERKKVGFNATGDMSASFTESGANLVEVLPLDEVIEAGPAAIFLKFDVEGAELEALEGAQKLIRDSRPIIALSVYHKPDDLWQLPIKLNTMAPGYRFFLRTQGEDGMDVICYAIPPQST